MRDISGSVIRLQPQQYSISGANKIIKPVYIFITKE